MIVDVVIHCVGTHKSHRRGYGQHNEKLMIHFCCMWTLAFFSSYFFIIELGFHLGISPWGGGGGGGEKLTDCVAVGHSEEEGVGGKCAPSHTKCEAKNAYYSEVSQIGP